MKRVLLVEDNPLNLELATDLLETGGFQVLQAHTAEEALQFAREFHPHLILMDIGLPGMNGLEAARTLKNDSETSSIPIVALTAHAMKGDQDLALRSGCDGYMSKPINTRTFLSTLESFLVKSTELT